LDEYLGVVELEVVDQKGGPTGAEILFVGYLGLLGK